MEAHHTSGDPQALAHFLESLTQVRTAVLLTAHGLTDEQARLAPTVSQLSVGGIIKHLARLRGGLGQHHRRIVRRSRVRSRRPRPGEQLPPRRRRDAAGRPRALRRRDGGDRRARHGSGRPLRRGARPRQHACVRQHRRLADALGRAPDHHRDRASRRPRRHHPRVHRRGHRAFVGRGRRDTGLTLDKPGSASPAGYDRTGIRHPDGAEPCHHADVVASTATR